MIRHSIILFIAMLLVGQSNTGLAQVLTPPDKNPPSIKKVKLEGVVTEARKYSFVVKTKDASFVVKPSTNAVITMRLNKPFFDFTKNELKVVRAVAELDSRPVPEQPGRQVITLPEKIYLINRFEHAPMFKRVMGMKVKRINNYLLTPDNPGNIHPSEKQLVMAGELIPGKSPTVAMLKVGEDSYQTMLGHKKASMTGFTVADFSAGKTEVFVWGELGEDDTVVSHRIEFRPIVPMDVSSDQISTAAGSSSKK